MKLEDVEAHCRSQPGASEDYPFNADTLVFRIAGKIFALVSHSDERERVTLKCEPELALHLRSQFEGVIPGYHTNKRHWNTVYLDAGIADDEIQDMIDHAYQRVVAGLSKAQRATLARSP